jgi:hypothetical protein
VDRSREVRGITGRAGRWMPGSVRRTVVRGMRRAAVSVEQNAKAMN